MARTSYRSALLPVEFKRVWHLPLVRMKGLSLMPSNPFSVIRGPFFGMKLAKSRSADTMSLFWKFDSSISELGDVYASILPRRRTNISVEKLN